MKTAEEIEFSYQKEVEKLDKEFLQKMNTCKIEDIPLIEKEYKEKLQQLTAKYTEEMRLLLEQTKNQRSYKNIEKKLNNLKEVRYNTLKIKDSKAGLPIKEKLQIRLEMIFFSIDLKLNKIKNHLPRFIRLKILECKLIAKRSYSTLKRIIKETKEKTISISLSIFETLKEKTTNLTKKIREKISKSYEQIKRRFSKPKEEKKTADQLLAEKILQKNSST